jgi:hypothetical protein
MNNPGTTPIRLVKLTLLGAAISAASFVDFRLLSLFGSRRWQAVVGLTALAAGCVLVLVNRSSFLHGIKRNHWTEDQLEPARQFIAQAWLSKLQFALYLGALTVGCGGIAFHWHFSGLLSFFLVPACVISELRNSLRCPTPSRTAPLINSANLMPLHSNHWGAPRSST